LRCAAEGKPLRVVADQVCTPTSTVDLAEGTLGLLNTQVYGLYHLTNAGSCTWHEFAHTIFNLAGVRADLVPISSSQWKSAARRPSYSVLSCAKLSALDVAPARPWQGALQHYLVRRGQA
jgi:dTDP-4-dehydrorhamnose reductase